MVVDHHIESYRYLTLKHLLLAGLVIAFCFVVLAFAPGRGSLSKTSKGNKKILPVRHEMQRMNDSNSLTNQSFLTAIKRAL